MATIIATAGAADANSYLTVAEAQGYFDTRLSIAEWDSADQEAVLIMATRLMDALLSPGRVLVRPSTELPYYITRAHWTGAPATTTQRLAWPRSGMFDRNDNAISESIIPQDLKEAVAELAGQLARTDLTADNKIAVQGITSVKAGSVAVTFKNDIATSKVLPDSVLFMLVPSWVEDEAIDGSGGEFIFEAL